MLMAIRQDQDGGTTGQPLWPVWTPLRIAISVVWVLCTIVSGLLFLFDASLLADPYLGATPSRSDVSKARVFTVIAGVLFAVGPLAIWILRRKRIWLMLTFLPIIAAILQVVRTL